MRADIIFCDEQNKIDGSGFQEDWLKNIAEKCLEAEEKDYHCEIGITFVDDEYIHELNFQHRGVDRPTDVLSFPLLENPQSPEEWDESQGGVLLGDIVISLETAKRQAEEFGHSFTREVAFLIVHSMMHLLGYDHIEDDDRVVMRKHEEAVLCALEITR